jgi:sugar transferase (PEP-CTERM system associated)
MTFHGTVLMVIDALLAFTALFSALVARYSYANVADKVHDTSMIYTIVIYVLVILFSSHLMESYDFEKNTKKREIIINTLFGAVTSFSFLSIVYYLDPDVMLGRGVLALSLTLLFLFQFCWHTLYLIGKSSPRFSQRVLVLGTGDLAAQIGEMASSSSRNLVLAGYASCCTNNDMAENEQKTSKSVVPPEAIVGCSEDLMAAAHRTGAEMMVVALSERRGVFPLREVLQCKLNGIEVMDAPSFYELVQGKLMLESITPSWFIFSSGFRRTPLFSLVKRGIDIILSSVGLLIAVPLFPLIALAIKLDSPGPVFFKQLRVGDKEKTFMLYKFRSMRQDAEMKTGAMWAAKNDPRITKLGRFFRNSRIDEIPQLINVLRGDMSFIGPRPERPEFVEKLKQVIPYYSKRHFIKPGLSGWAQVRYPYGSSVEDAIEKLRYDLYYIKNIRPFLDTLIFFETIKVVLFGRGGR